jgi:hypothetical protein
MTPVAEMDAYLVEAKEKEDPLIFWKRKSLMYPNLSSIALNYLLCPSSSTDSERIVSNLNFVLADKRSRLTSENVDALVTLRSLPISSWSELTKRDLSKWKEE